VGFGGPVRWVVASTTLALLGAGTAVVAAPAGWAIDPPTLPSVTTPTLPVTTPSVSLPLPSPPPPPPPPPAPVTQPPPPPPATRQPSSVPSPPPPAAVSAPAPGPSPKTSTPAESQSAHAASSPRAVQAPPPRPTGGRPPAAAAKGSVEGAPSTSSEPHPSRTASPPEQALGFRAHDSRGLAPAVSAALPGSGETQLGLLLVLTAAIFLLGIGALPRQAIPHPVAGAFIVRRRALICAGGLVALAAFLVSYFVT
jgi:hypothetical protein